MNGLGDAQLLAEFQGAVKSGLWENALSLGTQTELAVSCEKGRGEMQGAGIIQFGRNQHTLTPCHSVFWCSDTHLVSPVPIPLVRRGIAKYKRR